MNRDLVTAPQLPDDPADVWRGLALTTERHKLIWQLDGDRRLAFDLHQDPGETNDISRASGDELEPLWQELKKEWARARVGEVTVEEREKILKRLRDLGYI